jgi:ribosomal protein L34
MAALIAVATYAVIAFVVAFIVALRGPWRGAPALSQALLNGLLWPFLVPALLHAPAVPPTQVRSGRARSLEKVEQGLQEAWPAADGSGLRPEGRERERTVSFLARLRATEGRICEMERAIETAPASLRDRLSRLRDRTVLEFDQGLALLEELCGQLTLLRFTSVGDSAEREQVEALLARIGALAEVSVPE